MPDERLPAERAHQPVQRAVQGVQGGLPGDDPRPSDRLGRGVDGNFLVQLCPLSKTAHIDGWIQARRKPGERHQSKGTPRGSGYTVCTARQPAHLKLGLPMKFKKKSHSNVSRS